MSDDTKKRGPADAKRINVKEDYELEYWTRALGVSPEQLRRAVQRVGPMADDVRAELRRRR
ncbi:DUF3606 domain-containing protein [Luteibacter aegosomaticola]|uniref:DUF3606 domain-containing protein n=1 Tax=Luteibacter aegosomaticola TaxID=2911538 RepID=UPI001FF94FA3|nr:DUF3606 domain-containing protein [Luteibacter aegosomaticola]UPG88222.1 DUF3606 domain-containing protein [Luteibacter aegosomaticola]